MRIAAMAAGAVGGYFGARMAAAGHDVFFIARGANLAAIQGKGLKLESVHGDLHLPKPNATDDPKRVGPVDIVLFAVKLWDTETAAEHDAKPLVGANTRVITLAERHRQRRAHRADPRRRADLRRRRLYRQRDRRSRRHQAHQPIRQRYASAAPTSVPTPRCKPSPMPAKAAKLDVGISADIDVRALGEIHLPHRHGRLDRRAARDDRRDPSPIPNCARFFRALMEEAYAVGKAKGVALDPDFVEGGMNYLMNTIEPGMKASMAHDLERGNRLELDWLSGKVRALGRALNIPTPASDTVYTVLKLHRMGARA